jgi:hypothetical protein
MRWKTVEGWIRERTDLPRWLAEHIGRLAVEWSYLELQLEEIIRLLVPTHIEHGRILVDRMTMKIRFTVAQNLALAHARNGTLSKRFYEDVRSLAKKVEKIEESRNNFIHGHYGFIEGGWQLLLRRGSREMSAPTGRLPRAVLPQRSAITRAVAQKARAATRDARNELRAFENQLRNAKLHDALTPSLYISPRQIRQSRPSRVRKK